jgi:hypothetical protein
VIAFNSLNTKASWFQHDAMTNIEIQRRIVQAPDGSLPLAVFDGAVQHSIMYLSRVEGRGSSFEPESQNLSFDAFMEAKEQHDGGDGRA